MISSGNQFIEIRAIVIILVLLIPPIVSAQDSSITNSIGMELRLIRAGSFIMGDNDAGPLNFEGPEHKVTLTYDYYIGVFPVTQAEYEAVMGDNPSEFKGPNQPVESTTFPDIYEFCRKLSEKEGVTYRLPREAEFEYALRAGSNTEYYWGDDFTLVDDYVWYADNSGGETHPVGSKKPNAWGLYDMVGNVAIPTEDNFGFFDSTDVVDPVGPDKPWGTLNCVSRSCGWDAQKVHLRWFARSSFRHGWEKDPDYRKNTTGFRVVMAPKKK